MFKFFDHRGRILVLRPDITIPVARIAATKYKDRPYPIKFSYIGNMFRYDELGGGKQKEFTQAGVEIIGESSPEADAEVIALAINAVKKAGIKDFQIDIGQVEFFKGIMEETGLSEDDAEQMRALIDSKDYLGIEELVGQYKINEGLKQLILSLPGLFGSADVLDQAEKVTLNERSLRALKNLRQVLDILDDYGLSRHVSVDLGMLQSINYYTGIIFRGFTYGVGFPILSGGRYDNLVSEFGGNCPATGFSLGINMIMTALERQLVETEKPRVDTLVTYEERGRRTAFEICQILRNQNLVVELDITRKGIASVKEYALKVGIGGVIYILDENTIEIHNVQTGEINKTTIQQLSGGKL